MFVKIPARVQSVTLSHDRLRHIGTLSLQNGVFTEEAEVDLWFLSTVNREVCGGDTIFRYKGALRD